MAEAAVAPPSFEHPSLKEGFSDKLYRYVNEMVILQYLYRLQDFKGQELAEKIISRGMLGCSVNKIHTCQTDLQIIAFAVGF